MAYLRGIYHSPSLDVPVEIRTTETFAQVEHYECYVEGYTHAMWLPVGSPYLTIHDGDAAGRLGLRVVD